MTIVSMSDSESCGDGKSAHHHDHQATVKPTKQWYCPMCPGAESDEPGACPKCGMALERNPAFANQNQYSSAGSSVYDGLRRSVLQLADRSVRSLEGPGAVRRRPAAPVGGERDESSTASSSREMWERAARSRRPASG